MRGPIQKSLLVEGCNLGLRTWWIVFRGLRHMRMSCSRSPLQKNPTRLYQERKGSISWKFYNSWSGVRVVLWGRCLMSWAVCNLFVLRSFLLSTFKFKSWNQMGSRQPRNLLKRRKKMRNRSQKKRNSFKQNDPETQCLLKSTEISSSFRKFIRGHRSVKAEEVLCTCYCSVDWRDVFLHFRAAICGHSRQRSVYLLQFDMLEVHKRT